MKLKCPELNFSYKKTTISLFFKLTIPLHKSQNIKKGSKCYKYTNRGN